MTPAARGGGGGAGGGKGRPPKRRPRPPRPDKLSASGKRERRDEAPRERQTLLYGRNPVHEALRAGRRRVKRVWATQATAREPWLTSVDLRIVDADDITSRTGTDAHQGICADVEPYPYVGAAELLAVERPLIVALDEVQDPQNLGAIARSAECAGATGMVILERRSAEVTPAAAKASAGAVEHLRIARVTNLADFLAAAKEAGCWCYGAEGSQDAVAYDATDYAERAVLVMGAEGKGLRPRVRASCDVLVSLPLKGRIESLNVSAAAAVLLYELTKSSKTG